MKNYRFPYLASRSTWLSHRLTATRAILILALLATLSSLPFYVLAQQESAPVKAKGSQAFKTFDDGGGYIIYVDDKGETVCRDATAAESRALKAANTYGLHQINHLDHKLSAAPNVPNTNLTIILRATQQLENNPTAKNAFIAAAAKWEALIKDPITVVIDVDFGTTFFGNPFPGSDVLGVTSTQLVYFDNNYPDIRSRLINHATGASEVALANALPSSSVPTDIGSMNTLLTATPILRALGQIQADASSDTTTPGIPPRIAFNSAFTFDFDPSNGISGGTDFDAVAVHEMGHALGFNSETGARENDPSRPLFMSVWDLYRFRPGTANLGNFGTAQRILHSGGNQAHFSNGPEHLLSTGRPSDPIGGDGEQAAHWKADEQNGGIFIGIMDPTIPPNRREVMTDNDKEAIDFFGYTITATAAPPNDNFANAISLPGPSGTTTGNNSGASKETGEPIEPAALPGNPPRTGSRSVWYNWTATGTGMASFDTIGSSFDTTLAVYTGSAVNALTVIAANDDIDNPNGNFQSQVTFTAAAGTTYRIQVDGYNATDVGDITLHWSGPAGTPTPTPTPTPGPNTVQFTQSTASVSETTSGFQLTVTRTGTITSPANVDYATSDAGASERSDYETARGTLFFAANESSKTIPLFFVDDAFGEAAETFNITLSNPVSCTLGSPVAVQITINSDELVNGTNPVKNASFNNAFFVRQHYLDFFNREPDAGGLAFWKNQLDECENVPLPGGFTDAQQCRDIRRINVSGAFFVSIEFQQTGYLVERLYKTAYGDVDGTSVLGGTHTLKVPVVRFNEFLADTQQIGRGVVIGQPGADQLLETNKQTLIAQFVARSRFTTAFPLSMTPTQFVDALNTNAGGVLSSSERNQLIVDLTGGTKNRAQVLRAVAEDSDLFNAEQNRAFVLAQYFGYLRRNPNDSPESTLDHSGYEFWLQKLNQFGGNFVNAEMVKSFIISGEYQGRFGP